MYSVGRTYAAFSVEVGAAGAGLRFGRRPDPALIVSLSITPLLTGFTQQQQIICQQHPMHKLPISI